jgi:hypothetical protein
MKYSAIPTIGLAFIMTLSFLLLTGLTSGQSIEQKLSQRIVFVPDSARPFDQLIELAKRFQVPMGIEWNAGSPESLEKGALARSNTVGSLITAIVRQSPDHSVEIRDGIVNILSRSLIDSHKNFLNLTIPDFELNQQDLFTAQWLLHRKIRLMLNPNENRNFVGGPIITPGRGDGFDKTNITLDLKDITVRDILNRMALANGNALWIVYMNSSKGNEEEQLSMQLESLKEKRHPDHPWQFVPLGMLENK